MKKRIVKRIISAGIFALMFTFLPAGIQIVAENTNQFILERQDADEFFLYHKVEPSQKEYKQGDELKMISFLDVYAPVNFRWNDILCCDYLNDEQGYSFIGAQITEADNVSLGEGKISQWVWSGTKPLTPAKCFIESNITAEVGFGVEKEQKVISDDFKIQ